MRYQQVRSVGAGPNRYPEVVPTADQEIFTALIRIKAGGGAGVDNVGMESRVDLLKGLDMTTMQTREIVHIDEDKCDGCGECVPNCAEGAIQVIDGKVKLLADNLCDGLGACLGVCPQGAITVEPRPAEAFDEAAVEAAQIRAENAAPAKPGGCPGSTMRDLPTAPKVADDAPPMPCGCPGSLARDLPAASQADGATPAMAGGGAPARSELGHWPVQLALLPPGGGMWNDADVLLAADCVPFAMPDFHQRLLAGKTLAIACPKLDDPGPYVDKLASIFAGSNVRSITVARMEVPCCGLERIVQVAMERAGKTIPLTTIVVGVEGKMRSINGVPVM